MSGRCAATAFARPPARAAGPTGPDAILSHGSTSRTPAMTLFTRTDDLRNDEQQGAGRAGSRSTGPADLLHRDKPHRERVHTMARVLCCDPLAKEDVAQM